MEFPDLFFDEDAELVITRRDRPHWKQAGKVYFVTWRQADSLAKVQRDQIIRDRKAWFAKHGNKPLNELSVFERRRYYRLFNERIERWLDAGAGSCALRLPGPREEMRQALHHFNGERYQLGTFAIAANHVHVLVVPFVGVDLSVITHGWKSYTSRRINALLGRTGSFWRHESYDHIVRSPNSLMKFEANLRDHHRQGAFVEEQELFGLADMRA